MNALSLLVEFLDSSYPSNELDQVILDPWNWLKPANLLMRPGFP